MLPDRYTTLLEPVCRGHAVYNPLDIQHGGSLGDAGFFVEDHFEKVADSSYIRSHRADL